MKKFLIPIILAAVLGIGSGITAAMVNKANVANAGANEDAFPTNIEVKSGKYYLNGDKESGLWIEVNPDFLTLKGDDLDTALINAAKECYSDIENVTDGMINSLYNDMKLLYCAEKDYLVENFMPAQSKYALKVSRSGERTDRESLKNTNTNAAFLYNKAENSIRLGMLGDFILVED